MLKPFVFPFSAMAKPRLNLRSKKDHDLKVYAQSVIHTMQNSPHFASYGAQVQAAADQVQAYGAALTEQAVAETQLRAATQRKRQERLSLEQALAGLSSVVALVSEGRAAVVAASGMELRRPRTPVGRLRAPGNLRARPALYEGACDLAWEGVRGASVYEVECQRESLEAPWERALMITATKGRATSLVPGALYYFRVRAIGTAGEGAWSDPALCRAG